MQRTLSSPPYTASQTSCLASSLCVCVCAKNVIISPPTHPVADHLHSIKHVQVQKCYHLPPHTPSQTSCVTLLLRACARNVLISLCTPPQTLLLCACTTNEIIPHPAPDQLHISIEHVCKCKEPYHPPPPHPKLEVM